MFGARAIQRRREKEEELKVDCGLWIREKRLDTRSGLRKSERNTPCCNQHSLDA